MIRDDWSWSEKVGVCIETFMRIDKTKLVLIDGRYDMTRFFSYSEKLGTLEVLLGADRRWSKLMSRDQIKTKNCSQKFSYSKKLGAEARVVEEMLGADWSWITKG